MKTPEEILNETFPQWSGYITPGEIVEALDAAGYVIVEKDELEALRNYSNALAGSLKPEAKP